MRNMNLPSLEFAHWQQERKGRKENGPQGEYFLVYSIFIRKDSELCGLHVVAWDDAQERNQQKLVLNEY